MIDISDPKANMYGCLPCPKCGSIYRWPASSQHEDVTMRSKIVCDDCGFKESIKEIK